MSPPVPSKRVHYPTPDYSHVKPKVHFPCVYTPPKSIFSKKVALDQVNLISTGGPQTPWTSQHRVSQEVPWSEGYLRLLQEDSSPLPIDYAGMEQAIDELQQEAKEILHSDISEVKCYVHPGLTHEGSKVTPLESVQSQRLEGNGLYAQTAKLDQQEILHSNISEVTCSVHPGLTQEGSKVTLSESVQSRRLEGNGLYAQTAKLDQQLQQVKALVQSGNLQAYERLQLLKELEQKVDSLRTRYMESRNLCHRLRRTKDLKFDPNLELLSDLLQCEVHLMEMKEPLVHITYDQPSALPPVSIKVGPMGDAPESVPLSLEESGGPSEWEDEDGEEISQEEDVFPWDVSPDIFSSPEVVSLEDDCPEAFYPQVNSSVVDSEDRLVCAATASTEGQRAPMSCSLSPASTSVCCHGDHLQPLTSSERASYEATIKNLQAEVSRLNQMLGRSQRETADAQTDTSPPRTGTDDGMRGGTETQTADKSTQMPKDRRRKPKPDIDTNCQPDVGPAQNVLRGEPASTTPHRFSSSRARKPRPQRAASSPTTNEGSVPGVRGRNEVKRSLIDPRGQTSRPAEEKKVKSRRRFEGRTLNGASGGS